MPSNLHLSSSVIPSSQLSECLFQAGSVRRILGFSFSINPTNIQDLGWPELISLQSKSFSEVFLAPLEKMLSFKHQFLRFQPSFTPAFVIHT